MLLRMKSEGRIYVPRQPGKSGIRFIWCLFGHLCLNRMWKHILICDCATSIPISLHVHLCLTGGRFALFPCSSSVYKWMLTEALAHTPRAYTSEHWTGRFGLSPQPWDWCKTPHEWAGGSCIRKLVHSRPKDHVLVVPGYEETIRWALTASWVVAQKVVESRWRLGRRGGRN